MTVKDLHLTTGCDPRLIYRLVAGGRLPHARIGKRLYFRTDAARHLFQVNG